MVKQAVVIRIRSLSTDPDAPRWVIGGTRYNRVRAQQYADAIRHQLGRPTYVEPADWYR